MSIRDLERNVPIPEEESPLCLRDGNRTDQSTFHAIYRTMPEQMQAELVRGVVHLMTPVRVHHGESHSEAIGWLIMFKSGSAGIQVLDNTTIILGPTSEPQPDSGLRVLESYGGRTHIDEDGYIVGAPELLVEVSISSIAYDLGDKKNDYEDAGAIEYVAILYGEKKQIHWFHLVEGHYQEIPPDSDGILRSRQFPGLWLDPQALLRADTARVFQVVQEGLASPQHQDWVTSMRERVSRKDGG